MSELRRRKGKSESVKPDSHLSAVAQSTEKLVKGVSTSALVNYLAGLCVAVLIGYYYSTYAKLIHENDMWFSNIKQVEREISFRTESGLYFSYFKQMVVAPSAAEGIRQLVYDNKTEHLRTINLLNRFNIYQELVLGLLYRAMPVAWQSSIEYVYFYLDAIFGLHGVYMMALYFCAWMLSGTWTAGVLANAFYVFNRQDMTRLSYTMPLRESFSLPFIYVQVALVTLLFKPTTSGVKQKLCYGFVFVSTTLLTITWQFAQFVLLMELFALYGLYVLEYAPASKVRNLFLIILGSLLTVWVLQFFNDMLFTSLASSFCYAALLLILAQKSGPVQGGIVKKLLVVTFRIVAVLTLMYLFSFVIRKLTQVDSDEHVFKFVMSKLGYGEFGKKDFDAMLYLCEGTFQGMPMDTFYRLTDGVVFPVYVMSAVPLLLLLAFSTIQKLRSVPSPLDEHPEIVFNFMVSVFFGVMALSTLRMKFLWLPHMCVVAAGLFCNQTFWQTCLASLNMGDKVNFLIRHSVPVWILAIVLFQKLEEARNELKELREFHDPDTVELMEWISDWTSPDAAFTGSMQLMAGVKLCTDRSITNHPHYENKFLRQRTKEVYQIYARRDPEEVHRILRKHGASYVILENSICYARAKERGCRLPDILDIDNGHELETDRKGPEHPMPVPRFCHAIKTVSERYSKLFKKVFENRTFFMYQVL